MRKSAFIAYNKQAQVPLKNERNAAAGALRNLDVAETARRKLDALCYSVGLIEGKTFDTHGQMLEFLKENGFPVGPARFAKGMQQAFAIVQEIEEQRDDLDFLIDGAVLKVNDRRLYDALGYTDRFPRFAIAYKFKAEEATTKLEEVVWQVGRSGRLTPLAKLTPVEVGGATVSRATLNNWGDIEKKRVAVGSTVWIRRSGDVIPEIMGVVEDGASTRPVQKPQACPACGAPVIEQGAHLFCTNVGACPPQVIAALSHFVSREAMDIRQLSEKTLQLLFERLGVKKPSQLYALSMQQLLDLPGIQQKKAGALVAAIEGSKRVELSRFLYALGIPGVGSKTAADLSARFGSLQALMQATPQALEAVEDVGPIIAASIHAFFNNAETVQEIQALLQAGIQPQAPQERSAAGAFAGRTVAFTGALQSMPRAKGQQAVQALGGTVAKSITKKVNLVIAGEDAGSKLDKARDLGIEIWDEQRFLQSIEDDA